MVRGNVFVYNREGADNAVAEGHSVFRIRSRTYIDVEEISGRQFDSMWKWETLYISNKAYDDYTADEFKDEIAGNLVDQYYQGQKENGVISVHGDTIQIYKVGKYDNRNINNIPLQGETYQIRLMKNINSKNIKTQKNKCLYDYLCYKIIKHKRFKGYTRKRILNELGGNTTLTINDIETWIKKYNKNISIYCWWENTYLAYKYITQNEHSGTIQLCFIVSDQHVYPVENDKVFKPKTLMQINTLTAEMKEVEAEINWKFDYHFNNYYYVDIDEYIKNEDAIINGTYKEEYEALILPIDRDNNIDIISVGNKIMFHTKHKLSYVNLKRNLFKHPTSKTHQNYIFCKEFLERKEACDILYKKTKMINFKFNNQSWGEMSLYLIDYYMDNTDKWASALNPDLQKLVDDMCCKPLVQGIVPWSKKENFLVWDIRKCYTMAIYDLLKNIYIPIYHLGDKMVPFDKNKHIWKLSKKNIRNGKLKHFLFYIPTTILKPYGLIIKEGIYPHILIQHLLDEKHITFNDIHYCIPSIDALKGKDLSDFVETLWDILKEKPKYAKMIINVAAGLFNTKYTNKKDEVQLSASPIFTIAFMNWLKQQKIYNDISIDGNDDDGMDWIRYKSKKRKVKDTGIINQYIVGAGLVRTLTMLKNKWKDGFELVGFKTDAIYLRIPKNMKKNNDIIQAFFGGGEYDDIHPSQYEKYTKMYHNNEYPDPEEDFDNIKNESLDMIQKYPYKLECNKKPPKYDEVRINALKETIGQVKDKNEILGKKIKPTTEEYLLSKVNELLKTYKKEKPDDIIKKCKICFNILIYGTAGSGKTTLGIKIQSLLIKIANNIGKLVLVTSFQRSTVNNWVSKVYKWNKECIKNDDKTFLVDQGTGYHNWDSFYGNNLKQGIMVKERKTRWDAKDIFAIFIDEFFQMPERCLLDLLELLKENPDIILIPIGDNQQMPAIEKPVYDWVKSDIMSYFVSYKIKKEYIPESCRFPKKVLKLVKLLEENSIKSIKEFIKFLKTKNPDGSYKYENNDLHATKYHLCHYRNEKCSPLNNVGYINRTICPELKAGGEVICDKNFETDEVNDDGTIKKCIDNNGEPYKSKVKILVGEKYKIIKIKKEKDIKKCMLKVNDCGRIKKGWFPISYGGFTHLVPANASTCFREQGREITDIYTIHDIDKMSKQELIVAISRGKHKKDILFRFSNIKQVFNKLYFSDKYKYYDGYIHFIPSSWNKYKKDDIHKPYRNVYGKYLLYKVRDKDGGRYVGQTKYNEKRTIKECLDTRMKGHLDKKKKKEKLSPVLEMNKPKIFQFYGAINDEKPFFMYGTERQILHIEKMHIRRVMYECKKLGTKYYNKDGTKEKPELNPEKVKEYIILDNQIRDLFDSFKITPKKAPSKNDPDRKVFEINSKPMAEVLGYKDKRVKKVDYDDIIALKEKAVAELCCCSEEKVREVIKKRKKN